MRLSRTFFLYDSREQRECRTRKMIFRNYCAVFRWVLTPCGNHADSQTCVRTSSSIGIDSFRRRIERRKMFPLTTVSASVLGEDHPGEIAGGLFNGSGADMEIKTRSDANAHAWRVGVAFFVYTTSTLTANALSGISRPPGAACWTLQPKCTR